jgi:peptide/nickel transport system substrate-binding protein
MRTVRTVIAAVGAATLALTAAACSPAADEPEDTTLSIAEISATEVNFDPSRELSIISWHPQMVYDFIIKPDDEIRDDREGGPRSYEPGLATEWEYSDDGLEFRFTVRDNATYSDGVPVTAETIKADLDYKINAETSSSTLKSRHISEVEVTGEYEVVIHLSEPPSPDRDWFIAILGETGVAAPSALEDPDALVNNPVGSGPYTLDQENTEQGVVYTYLKRDDHWDADSYAYDTVIIKKYADAVAALNALQSGQVDVTMLDGTTVEGAKDAGFGIFEGGGRWEALILGDRQGTGPTGDLRVRQAISMAFDREAINETVNGGYGTVSNQIYAPGQDEYQEDRLDEYPYDPEGARELLAEAGYPDGFELRLPRFQDIQFGVQYWPVIESSLADIGITVIWDDIPVTQFGTDILEAPKWPVVYLLTDYVSSTPAFVVPWPDGFVNPNWPYSDPELDQLVHDRRLGNPEEVRAASDGLGNYVLDNAFFAVLGQPAVLAAAKPGIEIGMRSVTGQPPFVQDIRPAT